MIQSWLDCLFNIDYATLSISQPTKFYIKLSIPQQQIQMLKLNKQNQAIGNRQNPQSNNISAFNGIVKEFVINTIDMVKKNIHEEDDIIEQMLQLLQKKITMVYSKQPQTYQMQPNNINNHKMALQKIQSAVQQLNKDSDILSERLFDLSQTLIQRRILQIEQEKRQIERVYENKLIRLKSQYENEKALIQSQLKQTKQKCYILEECLDARQELIRKESQKQDQNRKHELVKYLQVIESIYSELQILKNFSNQQSNNESEQLYEYPASPRAYPDNYSQQYYNIRKDERSTQAGSQQRRLKSPSNYNYGDNYGEYQTEADRKTYQSRKQFDLDRRQVDRRPTSKNKQIQPRYGQVLSPRHNYYLKSESDKRQRSRSSDKEKKDKRDSNYKVRPIILHYQTPPTQIKNYPMKDSQIYTRRSLKIDNQSEFKRIEEKNIRMQGVQQKLHGLKRKLERELKTMKS